MDWLKARIKEEDRHHSVRPVAGPARLADWDPMIQKALTYLPEAQALEDNAHKVLAEKARRAIPERRASHSNRSHARSNFGDAGRPSPPGWPVCFYNTNLP